MADFTKDREEQMDVPVNFDPRLNTGDSVSSITSVEITTQTGGAGAAWSDASSEFGTPTGSLSGDVVTVTLGAASGTDQVATESTTPSTNYRVRVTVATTNGETLIAHPSLKITADGDTDAP